MATVIVNLEDGCVRSILKVLYLLYYTVLQYVIVVSTFNHHFCSSWLFRALIISSPLFVPTNAHKLY